MSEPFHKRFDIEINQQEAQRRFINRTRISTQLIVQQLRSEGLNINELMQVVCLGLGEPQGYPTKYTDDFMNHWDDLVKDSFKNCLHVTEAFGNALRTMYGHAAGIFNQTVVGLLRQSECDLDINWDGKIFTKQGAQLLDETLINDPLHWLRDAKYENVLKPFEKGLKHWMEVHKDKERCGDVVTDMYEALEALAKMVTGQERELSGNREKFASTIQLPEQYKAMLKEYIDFGCKYRHSPEIDKTRVYPSERDTEAFMYLTGLFIRLAIHFK